MRYATFLTADRQLTKAYYASGQSDPYPLVRDFTSFTVAYNNLPELMEAMELSGGAGACMLKGHLAREINNEPRVGLTDPNANTDLLILDYDSDGGFASIPDLLEEIDPSLAHTDYIFQHSASSGITGKTGIRGHVFFLLDEPVSPNVLKQWLKKINLTSEKFKKRIKLSRNAMALCYALDITINQNDKLVYIAPPQLIGIDDPIEQRFSFHEGERRTYTFGSLVSAESNRTKEHKLIEDLQDAAGLSKRTPKYKIAGDFELLTNPASCIVSDTKDCGRFVRVNLNGGDSFAYWYAKDNPEILHNFKGEPAVYLRDVAPEYYEQLTQQSQAANLRPFVFRDVASNVYYNAVYDEGNKKLCFCYASSRPALNDFMTQRGAPAPRTISDWDVTFNPTSDTTVDFPKKKLNLFNPTKYLLEALPAGPFPIIERVLRHICVDDATYQHFIKWLAHIIQFRTKTQTAWVFQGQEGTGKGTLFHQILTPILGKDHATMITQDQADEQFNGYLRANMLLFLDEGDVESSRQADRMLAKFRSIITEPTIPVRVMRANPIFVDNYTNLIIATNKCLSVRLTAGDRRYNIAPRQSQKLVISGAEYASIGKELSNFTGYLKAQQIGADDAKQVIYTDAREALLELSKTIADSFFEALRLGDLDFFAEGLVENTPVNDPGYITYAKIMTKWMASAGTPVNLDVQDILAVYRHLSGNDDITDKRFGHLAARHDLVRDRVRVNGILRRVVNTTFEDHDYSEWLNRNAKATVVPIRKQQ